MNWHKYAENINYLTPANKSQFKINKQSEDVYDESNSKIFFNAQNMQMISSKTLEYNENMEISELHFVDIDGIVRMKIKES